MEDMAWIDGTSFRMGSEDFYSEEGPVHEVRVGGFWIDRLHRSKAKLPAVAVWRSYPSSPFPVARGSVDGL